MKKPHLIKIEKFTKRSGSLIPIRLYKINKKKIKEIFFIHGKPGKTRGNHEHKKCTQILFAVKGKIIVDTFYKKEKKIFSLTQKKCQALILPPKVWTVVKFSRKNSILLVLWDRKLEKEDYISNFEKFKKIK